MISRENGLDEYRVPLGYPLCKVSGNHGATFIAIWRRIESAVLRRGRARRTMTDENPSSSAPLTIAAVSVMAKCSERETTCQEEPAVGQQENDF